MSQAIRPFCAFLLIVLFGTSPLKAQFFLNGEDPARIKWNQIKGKSYTVIYPREIDSLAVRYLWLLENDKARSLAGLKIETKPLPVVLHPYTVKSNGLVTWVPKRMELYTQPASDSYAQNWETQLVLHESRHVGQITHFTKGIYRILQYPLGEQITGLGVGLYASKWFLEGDAVITETALSKSGRGREASFLEYYRAAFFQNDYRNWNSWRYGSFRYYTPDVYAMGYLIGSTLKYTTNWFTYPGEILDYQVRRFYNAFADDVLYKKVSGADGYGLLDRGIALMDTLWRKDLAQRGELTPVTSLKHKSKIYNTDYTNTVALSPDSTVYLKTSYNNPANLILLSSNPQFASRHKTGEKRLRPFGTSAANLQLSPKNRIYYTEIVGSPRWQQESYSRLYYYDIASNKIKKLSRRTSYHSPTLSPQGDSVAVAEYLIKGGSAITLMDADTGQKLFSIPAPDNGQITECAWIRGDIYSLNITDKGMGLFKVNVKQAQANPQTPWERLINEQHISLKSLNANGDSLYFSSGIDGVTNIYLYQTATREFKRLTNSKYGVYDPAIVGDQLFVSEIGTLGFTPGVANLTSKEPQGHRVTLENKNLTSDYRFIIADSLSRQAETFLKANRIANTPDDARRIALQQSFADSIQPKKYNKLTHLFRIHSWAPVYYNVDKILNSGFDHLYEAVSPGVTLYSQNTLGTAVTMLGYSYHKGLHAGHLNFTYSGLYPIFEIQADVNAHNRYQISLQNHSGKQAWNIQYLPSTLVETSFRTYIPFTFNSRGWLRGLTPQIQWQFNNNQFYSRADQKCQYRNQVNTTLQYYQMRPTAIGAIFPKWGFGAVIRRGVAPISGNNFASVSTAHLYGYLPGITTPQGLKLSASYQRQFIDGKNFYLSNLVDMPRGYDEELSGEKYWKITADYAIPFNFKGINLGFWAHIKRLQLIPYVDFASLDKKHLYTYGGDVLLDGYFFHIGVPVSIGLRYGRNGNNGNFPIEKNVFKLLFNVSFY